MFLTFRTAGALVCLINVTSRGQSTVEILLDYWGQPSLRKICVGAGLGPILVTCTYRNPQVWLCAFDFIVIMALVEVFGP